MPGSICSWTDRKLAPETLAVTSATGSRCAIRSKTLATALDDAGRRRPAGAGGPGGRRRPGSSTASSPGRGARSCVGRPTPARCPRRARTMSKSPAARAAHLRDGAALTRFLRWLDETAAGGGVDRARRRRAFVDGVARRERAVSRPQLSDHRRRRARTAPSSTTTRPRRPTGASRRACCCSSIRAASTSTAPPT